MKKIIALLLALCLLGACTLALAGNSKNPGGPTGPITDEEGEEVGITLTPATEEMIAKFQAEGEDASALSAFSEETQETIRSMSENADALEVMELNGASVDAEKYQGGDVKAVLDYDEDFTQFGDVLVVVSANGQELVVKATVTETGDLEVEIPADFIQNMLADENAFLAVLAAADDNASVVYLTAADEEMLAKTIADFTEATQEAIPDEAALAGINGIAVNTDLYEGGAVDAILAFEQDLTQANNIFAVVAANGNEIVAQPELTEEGLKMNFAEEIINDILNDAKAIFAVFAD